MIAAVDAHLSTSRQQRDITEVFKDLKLPNSLLR
jgi:hypothetical protein